MSYYPGPYEPLTDEPHRSWVRRVVIGLNIFVAVCLLAAVGAFLFLTWQYGQIGRLALKNVLGSHRDKPMNILLVGSDTRALGPNEKGFGTQGQAGGQRSDTIMILHIDPKDEKAAILSLPRDLWVTIEDGTTQGKINSVFNRGPDSLIKTIQSNFDIPINHYAEVDFNGFRGMVKAVGGVKVYFPSPARDRNPDTGGTFTGLNIPNAGCIELNGDMALAYVRSRHYQTFVDGRWHFDPSGDIGRIQRQQDFIRRVLREAIRKGARNPFVLERLIRTGVKNLKVDDQLSAGDMVRIGKRFKSLQPDAVEMLTLPTVGGRAGGGQSVLFLKDVEAQPVIDRFKGNKAASQSPTAAVPRSAIRVRVLNGSGLKGQAAVAATGLRRQGFNIADQGNAPAFNFPRTVIEYGSGQAAKANEVKKVIQGDVTIRENLTLKGVDLVLITGTNFRGITPKAGTSSTTAISGTPTTAARQTGRTPAATVPAC